MAIKNTVYYEVNLNGRVYYTNIKTKRDALGIARSLIRQDKKRYINVYLKIPETKESPSHTGIVLIHDPKWTRLYK